MSSQFQIPPNLRVRITYPDRTTKEYKQCVGFSGDGMKFEEESGEVVVDNRPYLDISVFTSAGWKKID